jgi:hypothetical protein
VFKGIDKWACFVCLFDGIFFAFIFYCLGL